MNIFFGDLSTHCELQLAGSADMNLIIGCDDLKFAITVTNLLTQDVNLHPIAYDFLNGPNAPAQNIPGKWVVVGCPRSSAEYRRMCYDGYSPDLVVCIGRTMEYRDVDKISEFYEGIISSFIGEAAWIVREIKKLMNAETKGK